MNATGCSSSLWVSLTGGDRIVEARFLLPIKDNKGVAFAESRFTWLEEEMTRRFGGFTYEGLFPGAYYDKHSIMRDTSRRYRIAVPKWRLEELERFLRKVKTDFGQQSLYFSVTEGQVLFL